VAPGEPGTLTPLPSTDISAASGLDTDALLEAAGTPRPAATP
jgi:hypothetical protein